jgi:hypothetical protein
MTMYIAQRFPSLVQAVLTKQRALAINTCTNREYEVIGSIRVKHAAPLERRETLPIEIPTQSLPIRATPQRRKRSQARKDSRTEFCPECKKQLLYELHVIGCSFIGMKRK